MTSHLATDLADSDGVIHACVHSAGRNIRQKWIYWHTCISQYRFFGGPQALERTTIPTPVPAAEPQSFACGPRKLHFVYGNNCGKSPTTTLLESPLQCCLVRHRADEMPLIDVRMGIVVHGTTRSNPDIRPISGIRSVYGEAREQPPQLSPSSLPSRWDRK